MKKYKDLAYKGLFILLWLCVFALIAQLVTVNVTGHIYTIVYVLTGILLVVIAGEVYDLWLSKSQRNVINRHSHRLSQIELEMHLLRDIVFSNVQLDQTTKDTYEKMVKGDKINDETSAKSTSVPSSKKRD